MIKKKIISNFLIISSFSLILLVLAWSTIDDYLTIKSPKVLLRLVENSVFGFHYQGKSETGDHYKLNAKKIKDLGDEKYHLFKPDLEITTIDQKKYFIISDEMIYDKQSNIANLQGHVELKNNEGLHIKTPSAIIHIDKNYAEGHEEVECIKGQSKINAVGFQMNGEDGNVEFKSDATVQIIK
jgi:LPS export ABC transporter protein LptC